MEAFKAAFSINGFRAVFKSDEELLQGAFQIVNRQS
jgi:hypothetical protein